MLPKILKNFNVFVDGRGYAGKIDEITLPKLTIKTEAVVLKAQTDKTCQTIKKLLILYFLNIISH